MEHYDVVIIGAGLAGLRCAQLLARDGHTVLLVDRKATLDTSIHTTGIFVRRTLEDFDFPADCLGPPIRHVSLYSPSRRRHDLDSAHDEFRVGKMGLLYTRYLSQCLRAGVRWMPGTRYAEHYPFNDRALIRLDSATRWRWVSARFLVGADGANSRVARDLSLDVNREWLVGVEDVFENVPLDGPPRLHCFLDPKLAPGYLAWATNDGEETHIGVAGYASRFDPTKALDEFRASLHNILDMGQAKHVERRGGRIPVGGVLRNIANSHGLLIGDAAGAVSPLTAGGLDPCMRLSTLAAQVINHYLHTGDAEVLKVYSGNAFRSRFTSRLWMRRLIRTMEQPSVIELGCAAMRLPVLNYLAWHVFFGRASFPDVNLSYRTPPISELP
ncbi:MAG TPA: NAD(P)/FAD-dependent oxidoreductase [Pyrinomonadaceae bacterium]|nr:NAD(P)/FAD-dependent oxidoreductase [Pyrinomonadaceae bacterium]